MFNRKHSSNLKLAIKLLLGAAFFVFAGASIAASENMGSIADIITSSYASVTKLITATAYLAGVGFAVGAIIKFKAHKDNPGQVPIGQPVGLLMVAAALLFLPTLLGVTGQTIFNESTTTSGPTGVTF